MCAASSIKYMVGFVPRTLGQGKIFCTCTKSNFSYEILRNAFSTSSAHSNFVKPEYRAGPKPLKIGVQGACFDKGQPKVGVADGPKICRSSGFMEILRDSLGHDVKDYGDIPLVNGSSSSGESFTVPGNPNSKLRNVDIVGAANKMISDSTKGILQDGRLCLTLGGDHSIGIGTLHGASEVHEDLAVLWVDAHCDLNTIHTSYSGNIHGMSLAFVIKELEGYMAKVSPFSWVTPRISAKNLAYIGLRDVDEAERQIIDMLGIAAYSMKDVDKYGIGNVVQMAMEKITPGNRHPLHMSFDIDSLDTLEVCTTGTPVPGGLTLREALTLVEAVHEAGNMVSMDLVEVNPKLGTDLDTRRTASAVKQILINSFGYQRGGIPGRSTPKP